MSRCVPFPPPGFVWNGVGEEALLDLLKVRQEKARAEKERRKEKRKRSKEKKKIHESQGLENSSLTEENELLIASTSQYDSSDNSMNVKKMKPNSTRFDDLIVNWVPPTMQWHCDTEFEDQDWLFERKLPRTEKPEATDDDLCIRSLTSSSSTCATYLPQADVHVLPFTLLF